MGHNGTPLFVPVMETTEANEEFAEGSRSTAIDSRTGILTEVLGQLLGRGKQPKSKLVCFPKETKYTREDSNLQPSVPKTIRALISLSQRFNKARFYEAFSITTLRQRVHQMQILGVSGGISGGTASANSCLSLQWSTEIEPELPSRSFLL